MNYLDRANVVRKERQEMLSQIAALSVQGTMDRNLQLMRLPITNATVRDLVACDLMLFRMIGYLEQEDQTLLEDRTHAETCLGMALSATAHEFPVAAELVKNLSVLQYQLFEHVDYPSSS